MRICGSLTDPSDCRQDKVHARALNGRHLVGGKFCLDYPSVGATETLMMASALAEGQTTLSNVAQVMVCLHKLVFPANCRGFQVTSCIRLWLGH
jgi:UDP-N-acetylglucosamine enolpyruvyl transferase